MLRRALFFASIVVCLPALISEVIGGWTRFYTSPRPIFSAASMPSLAGKTVIVTGANTGIGLESVRELARVGAHVVMACRSETKCAMAEQNLRASGSKDAKLTRMQLDLSSLKSIKAFAADFLGRDLPLHILMLNAGIFTPFPDTFFQTEDGFERHIGTNHVGHFYLAQLLTEKLRASAPSRVVTTSSDAGDLSYQEGMRFDVWRPNTMSVNYKDGVITSYGQSKLANILFAREFAARMEGSGVTSYSLHPGVINTDIWRSAKEHTDAHAAKWGWLATQFCKLSWFFWAQCSFDSPGGALTQLHLATADVVTITNGGYYHPIGRLTSSKHPQGNNDTLATELWTHTENVLAAALLNVNFST